MIFGLSTGDFYEHLKTNEYNIDPLIAWCRRFNPDAVELLTLRKASLHSSGLSQSSVNYLNSSDVKFVSYHVPAGRNLLGYQKNIDRVIQLTDDISVSHGIVHPGILPDEPIDLGFPLYLENVTKSTLDQFVQEYEEQLEQENVAGICFDTSHAMHFEKQAIDEFLDSFGDEIRQIHFGISVDGEDHLPFEFMTEEFEKKLGRTRDIASSVNNIIIEINYSKMDDTAIKNDINAIKSWFGR